MRIALDAMGGDNAPCPNIQGALQATAQAEELHVALIGDPATLEAGLADAGGDPTGRISIVEADGVVGMEEKPTVALRQKPNCSIARCWQLMASRDADAVVSAGNTGAVVAAGLRTRLFLKGVKRPGIAVTLPNLKGNSVLVDVGANPAARPEHLFQYALMGSIYAREILGIASPRIGLMNIGSEEGKGNELYRETHRFLSDSPLQNSYVGNVEGRGLYHGEADVLVCEGFVGNVILKVSEGMAEFMMKTVGKTLLQALSTERDQAAQVLQQLSQKYRYQESGGAPLLGIDGSCVICHGSSDSDSIRNALKMAMEMKAHHINAQIVEQLAAIAAKATAG
ncbi:MAG: phosphate acyltransferase PlsX [Fuerstiella sp.]|jgi:glycerol-3-phosphate acyltransferase PlsX|nr:phosphate acyltransferase PlsX [Fuerstiella sp.]MCP4513343.1 phosphate acyltransferase PlsX [Fuerstiella sp.]MDG2131589.1 phosphate acyltransferase PlsX [Fuerstiella sp.]